MDSASVFWQTTSFKDKRGCPKTTRMGGSSLHGRRRFNPKIAGGLLERPAHGLAHGHANPVLDSNSNSASLRPRRTCHIAMPPCLSFKWSAGGPEAGIGHLHLRVSSRLLKVMLAARRSRREALSLCFSRRLNWGQSSASTERAGAPVFQDWRRARIVPVLAYPPPPRS